MEVACGEYGDMVPRLVVAVKSNQCALFQRHRKLTNCEKGAYFSGDCYTSTSADIDMSKLQDPENAIPKDVKETAILCDDEDDDEIVSDNGDEQIQMSRIFHNNQNQSPGPTGAAHVCTGSCDVATSAKAVC